MRGGDLYDLAKDIARSATNLGDPIPAISRTVVQVRLAYDGLRHMLQLQMIKLA